MKSFILFLLLSFAYDGSIVEAAPKKRGGSGLAKKAKRASAGRAKKAHAPKVAAKPKRQKAPKKESRTASPAPRSRSGSPEPLPKFDPAKGKRFMGYHGTSKEGYASMSKDVTKFNTANSRGELGPGLYTTDDYKTARQFAGREGVVTGIYANPGTFSKMKLDNPKERDSIRGQHWTTKSNPQQMKKDALYGPHSTSNPRDGVLKSTQLKFNNHALPALHMEEAPNQ